MYEIIANNSNKANKRHILERMGTFLLGFYDEVEGRLSGSMRLLKEFCIIVKKIQDLKIYGDGVTDLLQEKAEKMIQCIKERKDYKDIHLVNLMRAEEFINAITKNNLIKRIFKSFYDNKKIADNKDIVEQINVIVERKATYDPNCKEREEIKLIKKNQGLITSSRKFVMEELAFREPLIKKLCNDLSRYNERYLEVLKKENGINQDNNKGNMEIKLEG